MTIGTAGNSFVMELNRLANGGTYRSMTAMKDAQGAANEWAGTSGKAIIGALNYKVSASRAPSAFKDLNGVCNELAGTPSTTTATVALRSISS